MDPQTALSRALLLLLFLHLSLLGCRSHPLGGPGSASELPGLQELLDRLRDRVSELQAEQLRVEPLQQGQGLEETWRPGLQRAEEVLRGGPGCRYGCI
ncbi:hypothetical protein K5549_001183 [Capra hircus]|nr:hypothetical protein K5549_001183 [Capra hircus]